MNAPLSEPHTLVPADKTSLTDDERIENIVPLPPPEHLIRFFPIQGTPVETLVAQTRRRVRDILHGRADRLLVVMGPCSIHDPAAARQRTAAARQVVVERYDWGLLARRLEEVWIAACSPASAAKPEAA